MTDVEVTLREAGIDTSKFEKFIAEAKAEIAHLEARKGELLREALASRRKENSNVV